MLSFVCWVSLGSINDWIWIAALATSWVVMSVWFIPRRDTLAAHPVSVRLWKYAGDCCWGIVMGMGVVFQKRAFHGGLFIVLLSGVVLSVVSDIAFRRPRHRPATPNNRETGNKGSGGGRTEME